MYAGPSKDAIYSLLVQHSTSEVSEAIHRNDSNVTDANFTESEEAAHHASCLYESKIEEDLQRERSKLNPC